MKKNLILISILILIFLSACETVENESGLYSNGAFVVNEGTFGSSNGAVSYINYDNNLVTDDIFNQVNGRPVGDVLQNIYLHNGKAYLVVNGSNRVEIVDNYSFEQLGVITGLDNPRNLVIMGNKAFISQWGENGAIKVVNLSNYQIEATITVGKGPEMLMIYDGKILCANGGGFSKDNTVSIIDPVTLKVTSTLNVADNPKEMIIDKDLAVWVLCSGAITYDQNWNIASETPSYLVKCAGSDLKTITKYKIADRQHPYHLDCNPERSVIYVGGGFGFSNIYTFTLGNTALSNVPFIKGNFYGFNVNNYNGDIYACKSEDFTKPGYVVKYTQTGVKTDSVKVGIAPNSVIFQ